MRKFILLSFILFSGVLYAQTTTFSQDNIRYFLDNGVIRVGFDRRMGGMISYFEKKSQGQNLINNHDAGRQAGFETRIYPDNPTTFRPYPNSLYLSEVFPGSGGASREWNGLPQGSFYNFYFTNTENLGNEPEIVQFNSTTQVLYIKCKLYEWGFVNNDQGTYRKIDAGAYNEYWIKLDDVAADISIKQVRNIPYPISATNTGMTTNTFININYDYAAKWYTYNGNTPWTNQPVNQRTSFDLNEPNYGNFWDKSTEGWTALTNSNDFGMGIYTADPRYSFLYGEKQFSNQCQPNQTNCLDEDKYSFGLVSFSTYSFPCGQPCTLPNSTTELSFSLIAGTLSEIRGYAYKKNAIACSPPTVTTSSNSPTCNGNTLNLFSSTTTGATYQWSGPNNFTSTNQNPSITNITPANQGIYTVTVTDGTCSASNTTNVIINTIVGANASSNSPICSGNTLNLSASGGTNYLWEGPNAFTSTLQNPSIVSAGNAHQGNYKVTVSSLGCQLTLTTTTGVIINQNVVSSAGSNSPICVGGNLNLTASGGTNYLWSGPNNFSSTQQNPLISNVLENASGIYTVTLTNGLCTEIGTTNVAVSSPPNATTNSNLPLCTNSTLNLSASGGTNYLWNGPNNFSSTVQNPTINSVNTNNQGIYTVTVSSAGCPGNSTSTINATFTASPSIALSNSFSVCTGGTINLTSSNQAQANDNTFLWQTPRGFTSSNQNINIPNATTDDGGIYTLTITNILGCSASATTAVLVSAMPAATLSSNSPICATKTLNLSATAGYIYSWSGPNNFSSTEQNPVINNASTNASGDYFLTASITGGCSATAMISVFVKASTSLPLTTNSPICSGNTLSFTTNPPQGGNFYSWSGPNSFTSTSANLTFTNASTNLTGTYFVTLTNINGCTTTASTSVLVKTNPVLSMGSNSPICQGKTLNLTSSNQGGLSGNTYFWKLPNGFTSGSQNIVFSSANITDSGIYTLTLTNSVGCSVSSTTNVIVNANPVPILQSNSPICVGTALSISASGGGNYAWSGPNSFSSTLQNVSISNTSISNQGVYSVTITNISGCTATSNISVFMKITSGLNASSNSPICDGIALQLNADEVFPNKPTNSLTENLYLWSGPNSFSSTLQNPTISNLSDLAQGVYSVTLININGCTTTATTNVAKSAILTHPQDNLVCNNAASFTVSSNIPTATYQWQVKMPNSNSYVNITDQTTFTGITSATLSFNSINTTYGGASFQCVVSGQNCSIVSNSAFLVQSSSTITTLSGDISAGTILETHQKITSSVKIMGNANVIYRAEKSVMLVPGFVADAGTKFIAKIEGCN